MLAFTKPPEAALLTPLQVITERLEVPFFVKTKYEFERTHPRRSSARMQVERQVRGRYKGALSVPVTRLPVCLVAGCWVLNPAPAVIALGAATHRWNAITAGD